MTTKVKFLITLAFMFISALSHAQSDTLNLTLSQAMAYATEFGYQSVSASRDIDIAKKKVNETLAIGLPQIAVSGSHSNNLLLQDNQIQFGDTIIRTVFGTKYSNTLGGRVDQLLFDGSYLVGLKASKVYVKFSEESKAKTEIEIKQAVAEAYFLALVAQQNIRDFEVSLDINTKTLVETKALYQNGFREDTDVDQIKLMVNDSRRLYLEAQRQLEVTMAVLKFTMGYDIDKPLKISSTIDELLVRIPVSPEASNDVYSHIDYRLASVNIDLQDLDIKNQRAQAMPKLSAYLTYNYTYYGQSMTDLSLTEGSIFGFALSVPLFSSGQRTAQLNQKKLELEKLELERNWVEQDLKRELMVARANLTNAMELYGNAKESRDIAQRIYDKSLVKFKNGLLSSLDLSQNQRSVIDALIMFRSASMDYFNSYIVWQKASARL
jgi:outer membrane protein TolC